MTAAEIATALWSGMLGLALGALLMAWHLWQVDARPGFWVRLTNWLDRVGCDETVTELMIRQRDQIASLQASLDDAHAEVSRLSGEKRARDEVIHAAAEALGRLHRQEAGK